MLWKKEYDTKIACISDVHGHYKTLMALIEKIPSDYQIYLLGDLIDRGKNSKLVIEEAKKRKALLGNHDHFMTIESKPIWKPYESLWLYNGGKATHKSYGGRWMIKNDEHKRKAYFQDVAFLKKLPLVIELPNLKVNDKKVILSHSTIHRACSFFGGISQLEAELSKESAWSDFLSSYTRDTEDTASAAVQSIFWHFMNDVSSLPDNGVFNVFGHSVQEKGVQIGNNGAMIDCGIYLHNKMSALLLPELRIIEQELIPD